MILAIFMISMSQAACPAKEVHPQRSSSSEQGKQVIARKITESELNEFNNHLMALFIPIILAVMWMLYQNIVSENTQF